MSGRSTTERVRATAERLSGATGGVVLAAVLTAVGAELRDWSVRSVHRRGASSIAVVYRVLFLDHAGQERDHLYVAHASTRPVPEGAARVDVDGTVVHVWQFPHDPYLPGLPTAVNVAATAALLRRLDLGADERPGIRTRSYRPTRRAVVQLRPSVMAAPAAYVKLLGGRDAAQVHRRTQRLVGVHDALTTAGLPVPAVLDRDPDAGRAVLEAMHGRTLRVILRGAEEPPPAEHLLDLLGRLHASPTPDGAGDPDGFADVERHVRLLRRQLPHRAADLDRLAATAATIGGPTGTVHGDLHDGQVLVDGGRITGLLDVDGAGTGHVAHDVGRLLAGVEASRFAATGPGVQRIAHYLADLRAAAADHCPGHDVAAATAAAWVGLATGPLRVASRTWQRETGDRLDRALAWAQQAD